jgi:hypothetical protein
MTHDLSKTRRGQGRRRQVYGSAFESFISIGCDMCCAAWGKRSNPLEQDLSFCVLLGTSAGGGRKRYDRVWQNALIYIFFFFCLMGEWSQMMDPVGRCYFSLFCLLPTWPLLDWLSIILHAQSIDKKDAVHLVD